MARAKKETKLEITQIDEDSWEVKSSSGNTYKVWDAGYEDAEHGGGIHCNCMAAKYGRSCKHIAAIFG